MEATGIGREAINRAIRMGKICGAYKERGYDWQQAPYLVPIAEVKKLTPLIRPIPCDGHARVIDAHLLGLEARSVHFVAFCVLFSMIAKIAARTGFKLLTPQLVFGSGDRRVISPLRFGEQA